MSGIDSQNGCEDGIIYQLIYYNIITNTQQKAMPANQHIHINSQATDIIMASKYGQHYLIQWRQQHLNKYSLGTNRPKK